MSIESVMPSNHLILCHPLPLLPSILPNIRIFSSESVLCIRWPEYCSFSFSITPSNEYSGLISFRIDWFDLLAVLGTLKSLLQQFKSINFRLTWCTDMEDIGQLSSVGNHSAYNLSRNVCSCIPPLPLSYKHSRHACATPFILTEDSHPGLCDLYPLL